MTVGTPEYFSDPDDGVLLDLNAQVGPFGATVNGALGLLTDATLLGTHPAPGGIDRGVTRLQAFKWVQEYTGRVTIAIGGTDRVIDVIPGFVASIWTTCRDLVQTATAARIEAARGRQQYAEYLWQQYGQGIAEMKDYLNVKLGSDADESVNSILFSFPRPTWPDNGYGPIW